MEQEKILILNLLSDLSEEVLSALQADAVEVVTSLEDLGEREPLYVLVDSQFDIPEDERTKNSRILCFNSVDEVNHFLRNQGDVIFNPQFAQSDVGKVLLDRFFSRETVVQMETAYDGILRNSYSTKFSNPLTVGYYTDIIAKYAHTEKADIVGLRTFLSAVSSFFTYLTKDKVSWFPLDVDYGMTNDAMVVQITSPVAKVYKDYVIQSLTDENPTNPFVGLMEICTKQAHAIDLYYLEKANKLVITGVWLKDYENLGPSFFPTLLINQLYTFEELRDLRKNAITSKIKVDSEEVEVDYDAIPGKGAETFDEEPFEEKKNLLSIKKLVDFIKDYRKTEDDAKPEQELQLRDIGRYLRKYPDQREINQLEQSDREAILKCFKNDSMREEMEETVTVVKSSIDKEEFLQTVLDNLTEMDEEDAKTIAGSGPEKEHTEVVGGEDNPDLDTLNIVSGEVSEDEMFTRIGGGEGNNKEKAQTAKGQKQEKEAKTVIKGGNGDDSEKGLLKFKNLSPAEKEEKENFIGKESAEIDLGNVREAMRKKNSKGLIDEDLVLGNWEGKKKNISEKVSERLEELKNNGEETDLATLEEEIMTVFKAELGEDAVAETVVKSLTDDASDKLVNEKLSQIQDTKRKIEAEQSEQALSLRDEQLGRMKKVLDTIKEENNKLKAQLGESNMENRALAAGSASSGLSSDVELKTAQNELQSAQKALDVKDIAMEKLRESQQTALENKDKQIEQIQQRLDSVLDAKAADGDPSMATEMKNLANENRLLQSQLDVKDRTIENMSKRIEDGAQTESNRTTVELQKEKEKNKVALEAMRAFKAEKAQLEGKLRVAQREARQKETELNIAKAKTSNTGGASSKDLIEKDREIQGMKNEQQKMEEQNKALNIRCKQLEQKMRFLNAQVENANKKGKAGGRSGGPNASSGREAKLALKLKQVETAREKMAMDTQRLSSQLDSKKKENVQLNTENNTLKNKIAELEQKLKVKKAA